MDLYIANTSEQDHVFHWREPEQTRIFNMPIPAGTQVKVLSGKLPEVVNYVIDQHKVYGLMAFSELQEAKSEKVQLVYAVDKPLPQDAYTWAQEINEDVNFQKVQLEKEKMAYGFTKSLEQNPELRQGIKEVELSIVEEVPPEPGRKGKDRVIQTFTSTVTGE